MVTKVEKKSTQYLEEARIVTLKTDMAEAKTNVLMDYLDTVRKASWC